MIFKDKYNFSLIVNRFLVLTFWSNLGGELAYLPLLKNKGENSPNFNFQLKQWVSIRV